MVVLNVMTAAGIGGLERVFYNSLRNRHLFKDVRFLVFYTYKDNSINTQLKQWGVDVFFELKMSRLKNILYYHYAVFFKLARYIWTQKVTILHAHDNFSMLYGLILKLVFRFKLIRTYHGAENQYSASDNFYFRMFYKVVDKHVFVSHSFLKTFTQNNQISSEDFDHVVIYNGVEIPKPTTLRSLPQNHAFSLVMVGNYSGGRDHLFVIRVFKELLVHFPESTLKLVGKPVAIGSFKYQEAVMYVKENGLSAQVEFLTNVSDTSPYLHGSDLFIYASTRDTFGMAIVEAMFMGVPCLINDLDVFTELSCHGKYASLYETGNIDDCVQRCLEILNNYATHQGNSMNLVEEVQNRYSVKQYAGNLMNLYRGI